MRPYLRALMTMNILPTGVRASNIIDDLHYVCMYGGRRVAEKGCAPGLPFENHISYWTNNRLCFAPSCLLGIWLLLDYIQAFASLFIGSRRKSWFESSCFRSEDRRPLDLFVIGYGLGERRPKIKGMISFHLVRCRNWLGVRGLVWSWDFGRA